MGGVYPSPLPSTFPPLVFCTTLPPPTSCQLVGCGRSGVRIGGWLRLAIAFRVLTKKNTPVDVKYEVADFSAVSNFDGDKYSRALVASKNKCDEQLLPEQSCIMMYFLRC